MIKRGFYTVMGLMMCAISAPAETISVRLPDLEERFMTYQTQSAAFDLGTSPAVVNHAHIRFKGTFYPGKAYEWDWDPSLWFYYYDQTEAKMDPPGTGYWIARGSQLSSGSFDDESMFQWLIGTPSWDFLLDGQGQVDTRLDGTIPISWVILEEARAYIDEAYLTINLADAGIRLINPNGNETFLAGTTHTIQWTDFRPEGCSHDYNLSYSTDNGLNWVSVGSSTNVCSYDWLIPAVDSNQCLVRVIDANDTGVYDTSNGPFTIYGYAYDLAGDGFVDFIDYALFADDWQSPSDPCDPNDGDIIKDGWIDIYDLAIMCDEWLTCLVTEATDPEPLNNAIDVNVNAILHWSPGDNASSHDVFFGTDFNEVYNADIYDSNVYMSNQDVNYWDTNNYDSNGLQINTGYYWRIDEVAMKCDVKGDVWSFTTIPLPPGQASSPTPANAANNVSITQDLSWTAGNGATSHDVYFGTTNPPPLIGNQTDTTYDTGIMDVNAIYYWQIDEKNASGTTTGILWNFTTSSESDVNDANLIAWWKFDEGTGIVAYDSVSDNDGNLINGPVWTTGKINGALNFDGINDYVNIPDSNSLDLTSQATLSAWINTNSLTTPQSIVGRWNYAGGPPYKDSILIEARGDVSRKFRFCIATSDQDSGVTVLASNQQFYANSWYHVAGTYDGVTMKLYINGQLDNYIAKNGNIFVNNSDWYIGAFNYGTVAYFNGLIDDVRIYNRALMENEVALLYQQGL